MVWDVLEIRSQLALCPVVVRLEARAQIVTFCRELLAQIAQVLINELRLRHLPDTGQPAG
jgi:hypothetical protein